MNLLNRFSIIALLLSPLAQASTDFNFNFNILQDHFRLEIKQEFKRPLTEVQKKLNPAYVPQVSNVVKSAEITSMKPSISKVSVTGSKHGRSVVTVNTCTETRSANEWTSICTLDLESGDTKEYFNSGTENIHCTADSSQGSSTCIFTVEASVKPQRFLILNRSAQVLALGGIMEKIHDQAVIGRVLNLNETPTTAKNRFEDSNVGTCLDQIYATYQSNAQRQAFNSQALEVRSSYWRCNP